MPISSLLPSSRRRRLRVAAVAAALLCGLTAACTAGPPDAPAPGSPTASTTTGASPDPAAESALDKEAVLSPLAFFSQHPVAPVLGSDGRRHYAYELTVVNQGNGTAKLDAVQPQAPDGTAVGSELAAQSVTAMLRINGRSAGDATLAAGGSATLFLDQSTEASAPVPARLEHRIRITFTPTPTGGTSAPPSRLDLTGVPVQVDQRAPVVISSPLRGKNWVVGNGCCSPINAHRGATLAINGTPVAAQRFAIDFVQLTDDDLAITGDAKQLTSYPAFGQTVHAAAAGTVVGLHDGAPEEVPGSLPVGATIQTADGNFLVIDIGGGRYAFYAHFQPGSIKPKLGDTVEVGAELGLLGNTGNTDAPHLHFHIMDGPSPLRSNGLPFVVDRFEGQGRLTDMGVLQTPSATEKVAVDSAVHSGTHSDEMPLVADLVSFGE